MSVREQDDPLLWEMVQENNLLRQYRCSVSLCWKHLTPQGM